MSMNIWNAIDRYGLPLAMLLLVLVFFHKLLWPLFVKQVVGMQSLLVKQLEESQKRSDANTDEFLRALERRDKVMKEGFTELHKRMERDPDKPKKRQPNESRH